MSAGNPYVGAYPELSGRRAVWGAIARFIRRDAPDVGTLVELGAGYCDFLNQFPAKRKLGFDLNPEMRRFAAADVELRTESALALPGIAPASVDLLFASNFLEHLDGEELDVLLPARPPRASRARPADRAAAELRALRRALLRRPHASHDLLRREPGQYLRAPRPPRLKLVPDSCRSA